MSAWRSAWRRRRPGSRPTTAPTPWWRSPSGYRDECEAARSLGFAGKSCIHPTQVPIANAAFMPTRGRDRAGAPHPRRRGEAAAKGVGAFLVDGQMVDAPFLAGARAIVALAEQSIRPACGPTESAEMSILHQRDYQPDARGALDGVRVLDLSRLFAGNVLTQMLGDFGAEVIKVEPPEGDTLRAWKTEGVATHWKIYARNKKSLCLDLREPRALEIIRRLVPSAHMFVESFRPGVLEKMGLAPETLLALNPRLVIVRISGWGQDGPYSAAAGLRHRGRGHVRLRGDQRLCRPRAGAAADVSRRRHRRPLRRVGRHDRACARSSARRPRAR